MIVKSPLSGTFYLPGKHLDFIDSKSTIAVRSEVRRMHIEKDQSRKRTVI